MVLKQPSRHIANQRGKTATPPRGLARLQSTRRRRKRTFYRFRRRMAPTFLHGLTVLIALLLAWWAGVTLLHDEHTPRRVVRGAFGATMLGPRQPSPTATPPPPLTLSGGPSIDAVRVNAILDAYASPLHGHGNTIVALSRRYTIDDAVALAFFVMESRAGTQGEAVFTHSFGNLRPMPGAPTQDGYRRYHDWVEGTTEWFSILRALYLNTLKLRTVEDVVPVYAPASDNNNPGSMIAGIHQLVRCWRGDPAACPSDPPGIRALVAGAGR